VNVALDNVGSGAAAFDNDAEKKIRAQIQQLLLHLFFV
jgi:BMFP domain-containing protein YqiC